MSSNILDDPNIQTNRRDVWRWAKGLSTPDLINEFATASVIYGKISEKDSRTSAEYRRAQSVVIGLRLEIRIRIGIGEA